MHEYTSNQAKEQPHMKVGTKHQALQLVKNYLPKNPVIVEAGAYKGQDSLYMADLWPNTTLHLFEPVPELFAQLKTNTQNITHMHYWPIALSARVGTTAFHVAEKKELPGIPTQAGSLLKPKERIHHSPMVYPRTITVPTTTLDHWATQNNIDTIDFLWLDVQGHELAILQHAISVLKTVTALFVELHFIKAYEKQPLEQEVIEWLDGHGFVMIARDYTEQSDWFFGNGLFIKKDLYGHTSNTLHQQP